MRRVVLFLFVLTSAFAATSSFSGVFPQDDSIVEFVYTVQQTGPVSIFTTSFALGGFPPLLALFDSPGNPVYAADGTVQNDCAHNAADPILGVCWDSRLSWVSDASSTYNLFLSQWDNFAPNTVMTDPFAEQGNGNFTASPPFGPSLPGGSFLLGMPLGNPGNQRTGDWAVTFEADPTLQLQVDQLTAAPEPSSGFLLATTVLCTAALYRRRRSF